METTRKLLPRGVAGHYKKYLFSADLYSIDFAEIWLRAKFIAAYYIRLLIRAGN